VVQNDASFGFNPKARIASRAALRDRMLDREGICSRFFNDMGVEWVKMAPAPQAASTRAALARPGWEYVVYSQSGTSFTVDLRAYDGLTFEGRFYDPRTGDLLEPHVFKGGERVRVTKPDGRDWVFRLKRRLGTSFRRTDTNADGGVDVADAVGILTSLFQGAGLLCLEAADVNDDGRVDIADPIALLAYLFAGGVRPPDPFGECGLDPTPDELECESFPPCEAM